VISVIRLREINISSQFEIARTDVDDLPPLNVSEVEAAKLNTSLWDWLPFFNTRETDDVIQHLEEEERKTRTRGRNFKKAYGKVLISGIACCKLEGANRCCRRSD
jgi:hypothetical protein